MTYTEFKDLFAGIQSIATILALCVGGYWAYFRFVRQREGVPNIEFFADIAFIDERQDEWVVELLSVVENKGKARHSMENFTFDLAFLKHSDPVQFIPKYGDQVGFPHLLRSGSWLPPHMKNFFVDPGVKARYSHLTVVPKEAGTLVLHSRFSYMDGQHIHSAEKSVAVPMANLVTKGGV
jgi:hypothetical protein